MPPADTLLSLLQLANYLHARGQVMVGVPCFGGRHGRRQRTGRTGPPKHATRGYFSFPLAGSYLASTAAAAAPQKSWGWFARLGKCGWDGSEALLGEAADQAAVGGNTIGPATARASDGVGEVNQADVIALPDSAVFAVARRRDR